MNRGEAVIRTDSQRAKRVESTPTRLAAAASALVGALSARAVVPALSLVARLENWEDHRGRSDLGLLLARQGLDDGAHCFPPEEAWIRYF